MGIGVARQAVAGRVEAWRNRACRAYARAGASPYFLLSGCIVLFLWIAAWFPVAWHYNWTVGRTATRPIRDDAYQAWRVGLFSVSGVLSVACSVYAMTSQARLDRAERRGGGPGSRYAATVSFGSGTLSLYDRRHHPGAVGPDGRNGFDEYLALLDAAMDRGAPVTSNGRIMLVLLDGPDNDHLPADVRISLAPTPAWPGTDQVSAALPLSIPSGELVLGTCDGRPGREADVPPGDYDVTVGWRIAPIRSDHEAPVDSIAIVLRPVTAVPSWVEGRVRLRLESDRITGS